MAKRRKRTWLDTIDADVREQILDAAAKLLARRATEAEIVSALAKEFKLPVEGRGVALAGGLERLVSWIGVPKDDPRFDTLALCEWVVRSNATVRERMAAQDRIDELRADEMAGLSDEQLDEQILKLRQAGEGAG